MERQELLKKQKHTDTMKTNTKKKKKSYFYHLNQKGFHIVIFIMLPSIINLPNSGKKLAFHCTSFAFGSFINVCNSFNIVSARNDKRGPEESTIINKDST
jgi:hypothetical protein